MTVNDLLKRIDKKDYDKVIIYVDSKGGWTNIGVEVDDSTIRIFAEDNTIFSDGE